jgi:hypothetical protein
MVGVISDFFCLVVKSYLLFFALLSSFWYLDFRV